MRLVSEQPSSVQSAFDQSVVWLVALCGIAAFVVLLLAPKFLLPAEDAVILFQFSRNLAHTGAITYITNGPHAEGATDFAWMVLIAAAIKLHVAPFWSVALANAASLVAIPFLLARIANRKLTALAALFIMGAFALTPQLSASLLGFSTLPFAVLLLTMVLCFLRQRFASLAIVSLLLCLFRPDGVVFALPILGSSLILYPNRRRQIALFLALFAVPGICYFFWRWHYFGSLLPLPFLVKSDTPRMLHLFVLQALFDGALLCVFFLSLTWFALRNSKAVHGPVLVLLICLVILPNIFYFGMRLDQDIGHRFFIYLPVGFAAVIAASWNPLATAASRFFA